MSPSPLDYHILRERMELEAAERATCERSRASHILMARLHAQRAIDSRSDVAAADLVSA